jgi:hypothetical protein
MDIPNSDREYYLQKNPYDRTEYFDIALEQEIIDLARFYLPENPTFDDAMRALGLVQQQSSIAHNYLDGVGMDRVWSMTDALQGKE